MKRFFKMLLLLFFLSFIYVYILVIEKIPDNIVLFEGENIAFKTLFGIEVNEKDNTTIETLSSNGCKVSDEVGSTSLKVSLFNTIPIKEVSVDVIPKTKVIPVRKYCRCKAIYQWCFSCRYV